MKQHTQKYKEDIVKLGRQIDSLLTYTIDDELKILDNESLISVTPHFEGNLLKSAMKQLEFETKEEIPQGTIVNYRLGLLINEALTVKDVHEMRVDRLNKLPVNYLSLELNHFEYLNYGNYIIKDEPTYNADTDSYTYSCYDKMLYSMKDYENMSITYPITIRNYINTICQYLGLTFKNANDEFANYNKEIQNELYLDTDGNSLGYTFRDVLDELAQVTASIICINENTDELEIRYPNETEDTIDEKFLKDVNVQFKDKYGAINLIVLSRSAGADNIYYPEVLPENPCEIKITDNQIMNWDDRDTYMPDIYNKLNGLEYYINDFSSTGITWYELGDFYNIQIGEDTYKCLMLNDEINVKQGLEELIHTDMPEDSETDYKKADTSDRKIKKTILTVNKQEGQITGIIEDIGDRSQKSTTITADIDGLSSRVEDIEDVTNEIDGIKTITLENCVKGSILELHIYGNNSVFEYLRIANDLIISDNLKLYGDSEIVVTDENNNSITYELGITDTLRQNGDIKDEYILQDGQAKVIRRIATDGSILSNETIEDLGELSISLEEGINTITIKNYSTTLKVKYAIQNDYTKIFATQVEMSSSIQQTAEEINTEVRKKVGNDEVISKINQSAEAVGINASKIELSANDVLNILSGNTINLTGKNIQIKSDNFNVDTEGNLECKNAKITGGKIDISTDASYRDALRIRNQNNLSETSWIQPTLVEVESQNGNASLFSQGSISSFSGMNCYDSNGYAVYAPGYIRNPGIYDKTTSLSPNLVIDSTGEFYRSTSVSSKRYKEDIKEVELKELNPENLYKLPIVQFKYKKEYQPNKKDARYNKELIGFIAEDVAKIYPIAADIDNNGKIETWNERYLIPAMLKLIQKQHEEIITIKDEIKSLKGGNK